MKFSIIPVDGKINIDGVAVVANDSRVSNMAGPDIHAIQYDDVKSIGHIEYVKDMYDKNPRGNEMIYDLDTEKFKELHATIMAEIEAAEQERKDGV